MRFGGGTITFDAIAGKDFGADLPRLLDVLNTVAA